MKAPDTLVLDLAGGSSAAVSRASLQESSTDTLVAVAVPSWFGMADRHQLVTFLDPDGARQVGLVSSTLAAVHGHYGTTRRRSGSVVLCLDVRHGWSAGLVHRDGDGLAEVASWGIAPHDVAGRLDDSVVSPWLVDHLFEAASAVVDTLPIDAVLVIDDVGVRASCIRDAVRQCAHPWARCQVVVDDARSVVDGGASLVRRTDRPPLSVGALAYALTVRADGDPERLAMDVVTPVHARVPSSTRRTFDLGPNDGSPLHFDVFEQHGAPGDDTVEHRLVVRAHLRRERGFDQNTVVSFDLGSNGLLSIGPTKAWSPEWQPGTLVLDGAHESTESARLPRQRGE